MGVRAFQPRPNGLLPAPPAPVPPVGDDRREILLSSFGELRHDGLCKCAAMSQPHLHYRWAPSRGTNLPALGWVFAVLFGGGFLAWGLAQALR